MCDGHAVSALELSRQMIGQEFGHVPGDATHITAAFVTSGRCVHLISNLSSSFFSVVASNYIDRLVREHGAMPNISLLEYRDNY